MGSVANALGALRESFFGTLETVLIVTALFGAGRLVVTSTAADGGQPGAFTNQSIEGVWGFAGGPGFLVPPTVPEAVPIAGAGTVTFDGAGSCSLTTTVSVDGTAFGPLTSSSRPR